MRKQQRRMTGRRFTLIEIAVAMSIFALLMLILMQIFSATQNVWRTSSGKAETYESARVVLDLLGNGLESAIRTNSSTGEKFYYNTTDETKLWFPTMTATRLGSDTISGEAEYYFILTDINNNLGTLKFGYARDTSLTGGNLDFRTNANAHSTLDTGAGTTNLIPMLENVYEFKIDAFSKDSTGQLQYLSSSTITELPSAVIVTLKVLDNDERTKTRFSNAASADDREALLRTFRRIIYVNATN